MCFFIMTLVILSFLVVVSSPTKAVQPPDDVSTPTSQSTTQPAAHSLFQDNFDDNIFSVLGKNSK